MKPSPIHTLPSQFSFRHAENKRKKEKDENEIQKKKLTFVG